MKSKRIHYLQHVPFESLGCIEEWVQSKGHGLTSTKFYESGLLPQISEFDWLIVLGGPMGVYDEEKFKWLIDEKEFIQKAIQEKKTVIGICLGAQLIASCLGEKVYSNHEKEIGWFPIFPTESGWTNNLLSNSKAPFVVFHWHGDTFDLPEESLLLASSEGCVNQAFIYHDKVLGLQFHFEFTEKSLQEMLAFCGNELVIGRYIQTAETILSNTQFIDEVNEKLFHLLDFMESEKKI
jgi:GMP synthase-like glutamine amidotransferase